MNPPLPQINLYEEKAIDIVVYVINRAKEELGVRLTLKELADSRNSLTLKSKVPLTSLAQPLAITSEKFIARTIEKEWKLTNTFAYWLRYMGGSQDECSQYYYYEAIFSQPTATYPIPQATVSVFFRVEDKHIEPPEITGVPKKSRPTHLRARSDEPKYVIPRYQNVYGTMLDHYLTPLIINDLPKEIEIFFRVEGHHSDHDIRYIRLTEDWILAMIKMKIKLFKRIEEIRLF